MTPNPGEEVGVREIQTEVSMARKDAPPGSPPSFQPQFSTLPKTQSRGFMEKAIRSDLLTVPLRPAAASKLYAARPLLSLSRAKSAQVQLRSLPGFSMSFPFNLTGRMRICFSPELGGRTAKKFPGRLMVVPLPVSTCPSHQSVGVLGFKQGCLQERDSCGETKKPFLPGGGE